MNHLIIYAHPSEDSYSHQLVSQLKDFLISKGDNVVVRDLYGIDFNPILSAQEIANLKNGIIADDVKQEQEFVSECEVISVVYPLWWASFPAILKGYIDRVFSYGFGYKVGASGIEGLLTDKKVILHTSMGNSIEDYKKNDLLKNFTFTQGHEVFGFCGLEVENHFFYPKIMVVDEEVKKKYIADSLAYYKNLKFEIPNRA